MSEVLAQARARERVRVMRDIATLAIALFHERGFDAVTMEEVAREADISPATLYRRFGTKENLVVWQPDEQVTQAALIERIESGEAILDAVTALAHEVPEDALTAVESTGQTRLELIASHPALQAAARTKAEAFISTALEAYAGDDSRTPLQHEVEVRCVAAALDAATNACLRGHGSLRTCLLEALDVLVAR